MQNSMVHIVGGGLAGSEAAFFLAENGISIKLHEMRPVTMTEAHKTECCAELVCSNSFKSKAPYSAPKILKDEMTQLGSLILKTAEKAEVPGGQALAVDRTIFAQTITQTLKAHPKIEIVREEVDQPSASEITLVATGPLTSNSLSQWIAKATRNDDLYFYDAIAPIVDASTIDMTQAFLANRYGKGEEEAYLNCPMNEQEYNEFIDALLTAEKVPAKPFEKEKFFQGCQPIEAMVATGRDTLRFGPMKPVGLEHPITGKRAYAVVQLRPENQSRTAYNMVGFQTKLKYGEQLKVFRHIPALKNTEFLRLGSIHRNTFVCGPKVLRPDLSLKGFPLVYLAGQLTGVEGYLESAACGLLAGVFIQQRVQGRPHSAPPANTAMGALLRHVVNGSPERYEPANMHFGLLEPSFFEGIEGISRDEIRKSLACQAPIHFANWLKKCRSH